MGESEIIKQIGNSGEVCSCGAYMYALIYKNKIAYICPQCNFSFEKTFTKESSMEDWCISCHDGKREAYVNKQTGEIKYIGACQLVTSQEWYVPDIWEYHPELNKCCFD